MQTLNKLGGKHGIGRVDIVREPFLVGMKSRGVYETPGGAILQFWLIDKSKRSRWTAKSCTYAMVSFRIQRACYNGFWFSPEREALQALVNARKRNHDMSGLVRLKLYKGNVIVAGRKSSKTLYDPKTQRWKGIRLPMIKQTLPDSFG